VSGDVRLPPFPVIAAALSATTERLVREVVAPRETPPDWNDFEWAVARAVCTLQGIAGLLARRLRWVGPPHFREYLERQRAQLLDRDSQVAELLSNLDAVLGRAGIAFVPLKGSALRALRLHQSGDRPQGDVDLLLEARDLAGCGALLQTLGYESRYSIRRHEVYARPAPEEADYFARYSDNPLKIELHTRISETLPIERVDITDSIRPVGAAPGANSYANSAALLRHVSLHAAGSLRANAMRFIQIYDIALLASRMTPGDWREFSEVTAHQQDWWLFPPFALAARYVPGSVPEQVLADLRSICPRRLRDRYERVTIYEVSWSNLRIEALPGLEWSRRPGDALQLARNRLWPTRLALDELAATLVVQPALMQVRWYGVSHFERLARWLFTRPPRVQTLTSVRAALASGRGS
jgi:hypothetical protein